MVKTMWFRPNMGAGNQEFNWFEFTNGAKKWRVRPTAVGTDDTKWDDLTPADIAKTDNPSATVRNKNTIQTYCEFADFNLKLDFLCPDAKAIFTSCTSKVKGPQNWGNSGVKIFNLSAGSGLEVQIHDSQPITVAIPGIDDVTVNTGLNGCATAQVGYVWFHLQEESGPQESGQRDRRLAEDRYSQLDDR